MPIVTINRKLNLVLPAFETEKGVVYVHSTPISRAVFNQNYDILCDAYTIVQTGGGPYTGPTRAAMDLRKAAEALGAQDRARLLIVELERLTSVIYPTDKGYMTLPLTQAKPQNILDEDQLDAVEGILVYFTLVSSMVVAEEVAGVQPFLAIWKAQTTLQTATEFQRSLPTSTPAESTGETIPLPVRRSSVPA